MLLLWMFGFGKAGGCRVGLTPAGEGTPRRPPGLAGGSRVSGCRRSAVCGGRQWSSEQPMEPVGRASDRGVIAEAAAEVVQEEANLRRTTAAQIIAGLRLVCSSVKCWKRAGREKYGDITFESNGEILPGASQKRKIAAFLRGLLISSVKCGAAVKAIRHAYRLLDGKPALNCMFPAEVARGIK